MKRAFLVFLLFSLIQMVAAAQPLHYNKDSLRGLVFSIQQFGQNLQHSLEDSTVGWAFSIWENGKPLLLKHGGYKITPTDKRDNIGLPFLSSTRMHIASLSKTITALAIAKLVEMKKLSWQSEVKAFLPSSWKLNPSFEHLTVKDLLTMKSGLDGPLDKLTSGMDSLEVLLARGPNPAKVGVFNYQNTSYGLLRIIIANASGLQEFSDKLGKDVSSVAISNTYKAFVNHYIVKPAGIDSADCRILDLYPALSYPFPYNNEPGELTGDYDLSEYAGGFGWYLSLDDASKLLNALMFKGTILSKEILTQFFQLEFPFVIRNGKYGTYFGTGGDWGHPLPGGKWKGIHTYFYFFPGNVMTVVFTNSGGSSPASKMMRAYLNAFK